MVSFFLAYYDFTQSIHHTTTFSRIFGGSISAGFLGAAVVGGVVSWFGIMANFYKAINCKKSGASLFNAGPFNSFYILSNEYLNPEGILARNRLVTYIFSFFTSIIISGGLSFLTLKYVSTFS